MIEDNTTQNNDSMVTYSSSVQVIDPGKIFVDGYELSNQNVIESNDYIGSFTLLIGGSTSSPSCAR